MTQQVRAVVTSPRLCFTAWGQGLRAPLRSARERASTLLPGPFGGGVADYTSQHALPAAGQRGAVSQSAQ